MFKTQWVTYNSQLLLVLVFLFMLDILSLLYHFLVSLSVLKMYAKFYPLMVHHTWVEYNLVLLLVVLLLSFYLAQVLVSMYLSEEL
jgi:hypothetical protein